LTFAHHWHITGYLCTSSNRVTMLLSAAIFLHIIISVAYVNNTQENACSRLALEREAHCLALRYVVSPFANVNAA